MGDDFGLDEAYAVETPEDNRRLYAQWAATYDDGFLVENGYVYDEGVAQVFVDAGGSAPVLDVGCGTGAVGIRLALKGIGPIDGLDLSPEMLEVAATKQHDDAPVYRELTAGDLTAGVDIGDSVYPGIVSAGTFTHGHLGPDALDEVIRMGATGCVFAIGVNAEHYESKGFDAHLGHLARTRVISDVEQHSVRIYTDNPTEHGDDEALVVVFRKN